MRPGPGGTPTATPLAVLALLALALLVLALLVPQDGQPSSSPGAAAPVGGTGEASDTHRLPAAPTAPAPGQPADPQPLEPAAALDPDGVTVLVRVVDPAGQPLGNMSVAWLDAEREDEPLEPPTVGLSYRWRTSKEPTTDDGLALLGDGLEPGSYRFAAGRPPDWSWGFSEVVALAAGDVTAVTIAVDELPAERLIAGTVFDPSGEPLARALVEYCWTSPIGLPKRLFIHSRKDGRFALLPPADAARGALRASVYKSRHGSIALHDVDAGTTGHELRMRPPRFVEIRVEGPDGEPLEAFSPQLRYQLAGQWVLDWPGPRKRPGEPLLWGLPSVPFSVAVRSQSLGPLDPATVGAVLVLREEPVPVIAGRVLHQGVPVPGTRVTLVDHDPPSGPDGSPTPSSRQGYHRPVLTADDGAFALPVARPSWYLVEAFSEVHGDGTLGPLEVGAAGVADLQLELERPPALLRGQVLLPPGHQPAEVWLAVSSLPGFTRLFDDGSYQLGPLPAGPCTVFVRAGWVTEDGAAGGPFDIPPGQRFTLSHGPEGPPPWLETETVYRVTLAPGETRWLELDLRGRPPCWLLGEVRLPGGAPPRARVTLTQEGQRSYVSSSVSGEDGRFGLGSREPGRHRLELRLSLDSGWLEISDELLLLPGETSWRFAPELGTVRVLPAEGPDGPRYVPSLTLRWRGEGSRTADVQYGTLDETSGVRTFPQVPAGRVEVLAGTGMDAGPPLGSLEVRPGEVVTFSVP